MVLRMSRPVGVVGWNRKAQRHAQGNFQTWGSPSTWFGAQACVGRLMASPMDSASPVAEGDLGGQLFTTSNLFPPETWSPCDAVSILFLWSMVIHSFIYPFI